MPAASGSPGASQPSTASRTPSPGSQSEASAKSGQENAPAGEQAAESADGQDSASSDQVSLEDSEQAAAASSEAEGKAESEAEVLDAALEAMQRTPAQPGLEEQSRAQGNTDGAAQGGAAGTAGDATPAVGSAIDTGDGSLSGVREAMKGAEQGGGGELAELNRELNTSLGRFDGALLGERERSQAQSEELGNSAARDESVAMIDGNGAEGAGTESGGYGAAMPARTEGDTSSGSGMSSAGGGSARQGDYQHTASANTVPPDIRDGSDDDVVARQIREAAMKEKDPELRAKLWDEYRKYVNTAKGKS